MQNSEDRRRNVRIAADATTSFLVSERSENGESGQFHLVWGQAKDVSESGICVEVRARIDAEIVSIRRHPSWPGESFVRGTIVRARQIDDGIWQYGVSLEERIDPATFTESRLVLRFG